jgi:hypothetical protein
VPPLAVEFAGPGQDAQELETKIAELLAHGTQQVWVVRLVGPRLVEVRRRDQPVQILGPGDLLSAPGLLRNPVPVEALYDRDASHRVMLRNLLQRAGYESIEAIRTEGLNAGVEQGIEQGIEQGLVEAIVDLLTDRGLTLDEAARARLSVCHDQAQLKQWLRRAVRAKTLDDLFEA